MVSKGNTWRWLLARGARRALGLLVGCLGAQVCGVPLAWGHVTAAPGPVVAEPAPPKRLVPQCTDPLHPVRPWPVRYGEVLRYYIETDGLNVGTMDFKTMPQSAQKVTEYRSVFKLDPLLAAFLPASGRAAALVRPNGEPTTAFVATVANDKDIEEKMVFTNASRHVNAARTKEGNTKIDDRDGPGFVDFITAFYRMRSLRPQGPACLLIYGNQRLYTVWLRPEGIEERKTPVGLKPTQRWALEYQSDKSPSRVTGFLWLMQGEESLPVEAELFGPRHMHAYLHLFTQGHPAP